MTEKFLDKVYSAKSPDETRDLYDKWSASYDDEVAANGYITPQRTAQALRNCVASGDPKILDFGCGTGLSGLALKSSGFTHIDGVDISADMLAQAGKTGAYQSLWVIDPSQPITAKPGAYDVVTAIGVIGAGAAPITVFDMLMGLLHAGGRLAFSFNDHALADPSNEGKVAEWTDSGRAVLEVREYGDHLPGLDLKSTVYVLRKS